MRMPHLTRTESRSSRSTDQTGYVFGAEETVELIADDALLVSDPAPRAPDEVLAPSRHHVGGP